MPSISDPTLIAFCNGREFFRSGGPWLYPLLELEKELASRPCDGRLTTFDRVVGRAGALLSARLGIRAITTGVLSRRAIPVLEVHGITVEAETVTDRILCATEDLLADVHAPDEAHRFILDRIEARRQAAEPIIVVDDLEVRRDARVVLEHLSFAVCPGETILIRGENGAGKTTLLRTLLGLIAPAAGSITIDGERIGTPEWRRHRHRVAYVRQLEETNDLAISVREMVEIGAQAPHRHDIDRRIEEALARVRASHLVHRRFDTLSGGERQRVSIARALAQEPTVLLLDEPTVGLDPDARAALLELLDGIAHRNDVTVILVSHDVTSDDIPHARTMALRSGSLYEVEPA